MPYVHELCIPLTFKYGVRESSIGTNTQMNAEGVTKAGSRAVNLAKDMVPKGLKVRLPLALT